MVVPPTLMGLCDCNNFFVSCERLFRPQLNNRPVIVLSSNDGCVISRSNEAKALGIAMCAPFFKIRDTVQRHGVVALSGNLSLYKELSDRVMALIHRFSDQVECYSIDEAFFNLRIASLTDADCWCRRLRSVIERQVGIPVSIGIAPTKTLAKAAADRAKKIPANGGVLQISSTQLQQFAASLPVISLWGVGSKSSQRLASHGIFTVEQLLHRDESWIRSQLTIRGVMTARELRGICCFPLDDRPAPPQSLQVTRSFSEPLKTEEDLWDTLARRTVEATARLRHQRLASRRMDLFIRTSRFASNCRFASVHHHFDEPVSDDFSALHEARQLLKRIYVPGYRYAASGVGFSELKPLEARQLSLFDDEKQMKQDRLMAAIDAINDKAGHQIISSAALWRHNCGASRHEQDFEHKGFFPLALNS